ncbi:MAG TPA: hypothetical protein VK395_18555, partial [Gemmataceae bacterium]|nr:hypothetical protein [Gemmataceae bacterium]
SQKFPSYAFPGIDALHQNGSESCLPPGTNEKRESEREFEVVASGEPVETITKSATREFTGTLAEEIAQRLVFFAVFSGNSAASLVVRESSEAPKAAVNATDGAVHGAGTLSSPIADQPASIQPRCILAGWT